MASIEDIANIALGEVGSDPIASIDEQNPRARVCKARIYTCRDQVIRMHPWNCVMQRATLAETNAPIYEWDHAYRLPTDPYCLRVWRVGETTGAPEIRYKVEGRKILTNAGAPLNILYLARIEDVALWDALMGLAVGLHLAHSIAYKLTQSRDTEKALREKFVEFLREARSADGQEGTDDPPDDGDFLESRA